MLTLEQLKEMPDHTQFATDVTTDNPEGVNMTNSGQRLRWVALTGGNHDWAIYIAPFDWDTWKIAREGDKVTELTNIRKLVECDDEAFASYRY